MTSYRFFKMAAAAAQYYFRFPTCLYYCIRNIKIYQQTKFGRHTSIHGWDINTSILEKQTSAILEFYFRFRFPLHHRNPHVILRQVTEFRSNRSTHCGNVTSCQFFKMAAVPVNTTSGFVFVDVTAYRMSKSISIPNFVDIPQLTAEI